MLDPTGVVVEKWILYGTFLTDVNFNTLNYSQDGLATISATLRMERCVLIYLFLFIYFYQTVYLTVEPNSTVFLFYGPRYTKLRTTKLYPSP
jgi:hypothetical protein